MAESLLVREPRGGSGQTRRRLQRGPRLREAYAPLAVTVFRDMEDLLAFDPPLPVSDVSVWTTDPGPTS